MQDKIVITDYGFPNVETEKSIFQEAGYQVKAYRDIGEEDDIIRICSDAVAILSERKRITKNIIDRLSKCKAILRYGIGYDVIDVATASKKGIKVLNVPDYCHEEVAEHALALLLSSARRIPLLNKNVKEEKSWDFRVAIPIFRISGKILGLIGFGSIARTLANKAQALGLNIIAYDPYVDPIVAEQCDVKLLSLKDVLKKSDYVSIHTPLNKSTAGLIGEEQLKIMKSNAILINTSRGKIIDQNALLKALKENWIQLAALDTLAMEPVEPDNPLLEVENTIITPHAGWYSEESIKNLQKKAAQYVLDALNGRDIPAIVNKDLLSG